MRVKVQYLKVGDQIRLAGKNLKVRGVRKLVQSDGAYVILDVSSLIEHKVFLIPWSYKIRCGSQHLIPIGDSITDNARSGV